MQVLCKSRDPQADELRDVAQRRMRFVFRRIDWLVPRATVQLSDVNGPRGGIDKRCRVEIKSDVAGTVVVASVARRGVWLDRGELDKLIERSGSAAPVRSDATNNERQPEFVDSDHQHNRGRSTGRRKSWLNDIFD